MKTESALNSNPHFKNKNARHEFCLALVNIDIR